MNDNSRFNAKRQEHWKSRVGEARLAAMLESRRDAERCLKDGDDAVRAVALDVLSHRWISPPDDELGNACEELFLNDPDKGVRHSALLTLAECYRNTDNIRIGELLAKVVYAETAPREIRTAAFLGLYFVRGVPILSIPGFRERPVQMPTFENIDWSFVDSFLVEGRTPSPPGDLFETQIARLPDSLRSGVRAAHLGQKASERGDYEQAIVYLTQSVESNPELPGPRLWRGIAYSKLVRLDEAIADFTQVIRMKPQSAEAYRERSEAYRAKGLLDKADADLRRAAKIAPRREDRAD